MTQDVVANFICENEACPERDYPKYQVVGVLVNGAFRPMESDVCPICGERGQLLNTYPVSSEDASHMLNPFWTC